MAAFSPSIFLSAPARRLTTLRHITTSRPSLTFQPAPRISAAASSFSSSRTLRKDPPLAHNNEPVPTSAPATDFSSLDVLGNTPVPSTSIDICHHDGFSLNSGVQITGGSGALLVGGEAFEWKPWLTKEGGREKKKGKKMINSKWQWEIDPESLGVLRAVWPRPDLLILGVGKFNRPISPKTRQAISEMGMRVEVLDTRNAASQYNLLATERGVGDVAAALVPIGFEDA